MSKGKKMTKILGHRHNCDTLFPIGVLHGKNDLGCLCKIDGTPPPIKKTKEGTKY